MKKIKILNGDIEKLSNASQYPFPKYATQIINLLNSNAQGTRPTAMLEVRAQRLLVRCRNLYKSSLVIPLKNG